MPARATATGTISFGLVSIPIKLYSTSDTSKNVSFSWLHDKCGGRVKMQYWCPADEEVVERGHLQKGFEFTRDQYVVFTPEELKSVERKATHSIDIVEFVPLEQVDPIFYESTTYLGPDKGGDRPYRLLARAMRETGRVAVGRYDARGKSYLVLLRPFADGLVLQQLRYADQVRSFDEVPVGAAEVKDQELALARQLIDQIASDTFDPAKYEDEARKQLWEMIERKVEGEEIAAPPAERPQAQIIDLMEALKASLAASEGEEPARKPPRRATGKKAAAAKPPAKKAASGAKRGGGRRGATG